MCRKSFEHRDRGLNLARRLTFEDLMISGRVLVSVSLY